MQYSNKYNLLFVEWRFLLYGFLMSFWSSLGQTFFISLFSGEIRNDLNLSHGEFGSFYAIATIASAITLFWLGKLADTISVKILSIFTLFSLCIASLHFSTINSVFYLIIGIYFLRLFGQGMMYHVYSTAITRRYDAIRGKALAVSGFGLHIAEAALPFVVTILLIYLNWKYIWLIFPAIAFFTFMPFIKTLTKKTSFQKGLIKDRQKDETKILGIKSYRRNEIIKDIGFWAVLLWIILIPPFTITGIFFHQIYIANINNIDLIFWSSNYIWYAFSAIFGAFFSGTLIDKYTAHKVASISQIPMLFACFFLWQVSIPLFTILFFTFFGLASGMTPPVFNVLIAERYGTKWLGEIKAMALPLTVFSSALSPFILGLMIDDGYKFSDIVFFLFFLSSLSFTTPLILFNLFRNFKYNKN